MTGPTVSVVIVAKNEGEVIEKCLRSVFDQSVEPIEVIVVDGRSTDDTVEKARAFPVRVIEETGKPSPSNARNLGVEQARGEIIFLLDADAELDTDCLKNAVDHFQDPEVLLILPFREVKIHTRFERIQAKWLYGSRSRLRTEVGTGSANFLVRREIYNEVRFDPKIGLGDDSDFIRRLRKLHQNPRAEQIARNSRIFVNLPHSLSEVSSQYMWYGRTSMRYIARYHSLGRILSLGNILTPALFLFSCVAALVFPESTYYLSVPILAIFLARNLVVCFRSRSSYFIEFVLFDFARSFLYLFGMAQSLFVKRTGR